MLKIFLSAFKLILLGDLKVLTLDQINHVSLWLICNLQSISPTNHNYYFPTVLIYYNIILCNN